MASLYQEVYAKVYFKLGGAQYHSDLSRYHHIVVNFCCALRIVLGTSVSTSVDSLSIGSATIFRVCDPRVTCHLILYILCFSRGFQSFLFERSVRCVLVDFQRSARRENPALAPARSRSVEIPNLFCLRKERNLDTRNHSQLTPVYPKFDEITPN
ncbi:hypothetical protein M8J76_006987 [Diaphorina citri]|nr:hypothetical protein M8J76_006987 [Diaphorina citri]